MFVFQNIKMPKQFLLFFITYILCSFNFFAQNYSYQVFNSKEGLESPELLSVFQDSRGYLWVGGVNGLFKYNGNSFTNYSLLDGDIDNVVYGINEGKNHNLWLTSKVGVQSFDGKTFTKYKINTKDTSVKNLFFQNVLEASDGNVYATCIKGLFVLDKNKKEFKQLFGLEANVREITEDKNGVLWIAADKGLYCYKNNKFTFINIDIQTTSTSLTCINIDKKGVIWLGTTVGIIKYDGKTFEKYFDSVGSENRILDILVTSDNKIIFTSDSPVMRIYDTGKFSINDLSKLVGRVSLIRLTQDDRGDFWIASAAGLIKMYSKQFSKFAFSDSIKATVMNMAIDKLNNLYFATTQGLYKLQNNNLEKFNISNNPDEQFITSLLPTDSSLLVGTYSGQAYKFINNKFLPFGKIDYLTGNPVYQILPYNKNELWLCKGFNVVNYKDNNYSVHTFSNLGYTQSALVDSKNRIWFANTGVLMVYENGKFRAIDKKHGYNFKESVTLAEDKNHNIWIGTYGYGLIKYDGKNYKAINTNDNLTSNYLNSCLYDKITNSLWIGTNNGVSNVVLNDSGNISTIKNFNKEQGLESVGCIQNSVFQLPNSNILFGTEHGIYEYNSNLKKSIQLAPKLNFTSLRLNYEKQDWRLFSDSIISWNNMPMNLILPHDKNHLTFDFVGINLDAPENVKYQWILDGFDKDWSPTSKNIFTTYSNLPSGKFTFKLRASDSSGVWSSPIIYSFIITPPFWQTWWFILLTVIFTIISIWLFLKYRINQIRKTEFEKTENFKKVTELELKAMRSQMNPHFMFNALNSIQDVIFSNDDEKARIYLADFSRLMRLILENSMHKKIKLSDELEFLKLYLNLELLRFQDKFNVQLIVADNIDESIVSLPPMLIQPYIENAIIHGLMHKENNGLLTIKFSLTSNSTMLNCTITDNGIGRKKSAELSAWKSKKHKSMGIEITNERINLLNIIESIKGFQVDISDLTDEQNNSLGTTVTILIPLA
jgi:hypothetical protein